MQNIHGSINEIIKRIKEDKRVTNSQLSALLELLKIVSQENPEKVVDYINAIQSQLNGQKKSADDETISR